MIAIVYLVEVAPDAVPVAQDDAASAAWYDLATVMATPDKFAFDHHSILVEMTKKVSAYAAYTPK